MLDLLMDQSDQINQFWWEIFGGKKFDSASLPWEEKKDIYEGEEKEISLEGEEKDRGGEEGRKPESTQ